MTKLPKEERTVLSDVLDRMIENAEKRKTPSFRSLVKAADLDPARDFVGASLRNMDFRDEDLRGFDFSNADLSGSDFRRAEVSRVNFENAILVGAIGLPESPIDLQQAPGDFDIE